jgi:hypothetical protein
VRFWRLIWSFVFKNENETPPTAADWLPQRNSVYQAPEIRQPTMLKKLSLILATHQQNAIEMETPVHPAGPARSMKEPRMTCRIALDAKQSPHLLTTVAERSNH